jgi:RNA polymerase primary sigma factor
MSRKKDHLKVKQEDPHQEMDAQDLEDEQDDFILDDGDSLLTELDNGLIEEPDPTLLSIEEQDLESLVKEEPLELFDNPSLVMELSEDPVRLYLKEIGGIDLLGIDREFWLATRLETARRIDVIRRDHPLARKEQPGSAQNIYQALYDELLVAWKRLLEDVTRLGYQCPDMSSILAEAQMLRTTWDSDKPSNLRAYLDNGLWGRDTLWDGVARYAFNVFVGLYIQPDSLAEKIGQHIREQHDLPSSSTFTSYLPTARSRSPPRHYPRQPAPGGQRGQALHRARQLFP